MKTGDTVTDLGLYTTACCSEESILDTGDVFERCPRCMRLCTSEMEEEIVALDEFDHLNGVAA